MWLYKRNYGGVELSFRWSNAAPHRIWDNGTLTWKSGRRHREHVISSHDLRNGGGWSEELLKRVTCTDEPVEFHLVVDRENPQWYVERVGENLFVDYALHTRIMCNDGLEVRMTDRSMRLTPSYLPEVTEKDGIVGVRIEYGRPSPGLAAHIMCGTNAELMDALAKEMEEERYVPADKVQGADGGSV